MRDAIRFPPRGPGRRPAGEIEEFDRALFRIVEAEHPSTPRRFYYRAVAAGLVEKTKASCDLIGRRLLSLRKAETIPDDWILDYTRTIETPSLWDDPIGFLACVERSYRRDLWQEQRDRVLVMCEKEALFDVFSPVTNRWGVPLVTLRGYASRSYLANDVAAHIGERTHVYAFGDWDPSGKDITRDTHARLTAILGFDFPFSRVAVNEAQIVEFNLPTRPTKTSDTRAKWFESDVSVELDAIPTATLRELIEGVIVRHIDMPAWEEAQAQADADAAAIANAIREARRQIGGAA